MHLFTHDNEMQALVESGAAQRTLDLWKYTSNPSVFDGEVEQDRWHAVQMVKPEK